MKDILFININLGFNQVIQQAIRVWNDGLIHKINNYGFRYNLSDWFKSYLYNRKQRIILNNKHSSFFSVKAWVPQG